MKNELIVAEYKGQKSNKTARRLAEILDTTRGLQSLESASLLLCSDPSYQLSFELRSDFIPIFCRHIGSSAGDAPATRHRSVISID